MKKLFCVLISLTVLFTFFACGSSGKGVSDYEAPHLSESKSLSEGDSFDLDAAPRESEKTNPTVQNQRKIIQTVTFYTETKEFDALIAKIDAEVKAKNGYVESSDVHGINNRVAVYSLRIPSAQADAVSAFIEAESIVTAKSIDTDDVTLSYVDLESRLSSLKTEKEALEKILYEAKTVADIIEVQKELTEVIYQIESYQSSLRTYDNLIDYTTIRLTVSEVSRVTVVEKQGLWEEISTNLARNFSDVGEGLRAFFVWFVSAIPYFLLLLIPGVIALLIVLAATKKSRKAKKDKKDSEASKENSDL